MNNFFDLSLTADLLGRDFVQQAILAAALLGLLAGLIGPFVVMRQMSFAVHGSSELSLTGAAAALLAGANVGTGALLGSVVAAILFGVLGQRTKDRDSSIGVVMAFGLGLAVLFIHLYPGRTGTNFALLTGQIVGVGYSGLLMLVVVSMVVGAVLAVTYRPMLFATVDPDVAEARGVPVRALGIVFAALVGLTAAQGVQIVGALLVMSLLITPAAAAARASRHLPRAPLRCRSSSQRSPPSAASCFPWHPECLSRSSSP
ncbi:ABC 3 transport family protein [Mycobacteroides abscessus MAB_030201_1075]|uniref:ABC 3 transport family protein n=1 Tax=Mycobacteroides abscessus MAB_030201_1075 TaxID=1335410 RepID=A0A829PD82_9MYCO|nr:ABC 3 transport family protein [Mycobacteroides abscessus MAB_030201_1075]